MDKLIDRLKEPSTYAGLGGLAVVLGISMDSFNEWVAAAAGIALVLSLILPEKKV